MKRLLVFGFLLLLAQLRAAAPPPSIISEQGRSALSSFFEGAVVRGDVPGVVALVVNRDGLLYHEAFGKLNVARGIDMPRDAIFRIASMTKPLTSVAILMLAEQGKLGLDDRVSRYVPALTTRPVISRFNETDASHQTRPASRPITIRHLLTHTSGIGYAWSDPRLSLLQKKTGLGETELPLLHDPGQKWTYGASTRVLGEVIEKISGQPLDAFLRARIFEPLGMNDTFYAVPQEKAARVATVHQRASGRLTEQPNPPALPATIRGDGGLYSTAGDYSLFLHMLLNRGQVGQVRLLTERSVREMTQNQIGSLVVDEQPAADSARAKPYPLGAGMDKWGLAFQIAAPKSPNPNMRSAGSYSWAGINNTHFWVDPNRQIGAILLMQVLPFYDEGCIEVLRGFEELVYRHLT